MKNIYLLICLILFTFSNYVCAQAPEKLSYQAIIRNSSDQILVNQPISIQISILQSSASGSSVYVENQTPSTNENGLISIEIGNGNIVSGIFNSIDWSEDIYFIKTEIDPEGGSNYTITGTSQLLSVPYALYAKVAESIKGGITENDPVFTVSAAKGITNIDINNWNNKLSTEVDGSITNEIELPTGGTDGQVLKTDGAGNYAWVNQTIDTDTNTQLIESEVDAFVANNGFLTAEVDGSITNEIELPTGGTDGQVLKTDGAGNYAWIDLPSSDSYTPNVTTINSNTTLSQDGIIFINGSYTVTFPANPSDGMKLTICTSDRSATINLNGKTFLSNGSDFSGPYTFSDLNKDLLIVCYSSTIDRWFLN